MTLNDDPPIVHEVPEITPEVYENAEEEALRNNRVVIVNVVDETDDSNEQE